MGPSGIYDRYSLEINHGLLAKQEHEHERWSQGGLLVQGFSVCSELGPHKAPTGKTGLTYKK